MTASAKPGPRICAMARPAPIATPRRTDVAALSKPDAFEKWSAGVQAETSSSNNVVSILDVIGEDWWTGGGVTTARVDAALRRIGTDQDVEVHINSPGGDMFEGIAIYNRLLQHKGKVTVKVLGLAASAASIIAMAGDEVLIGKAAFLMIHNCWVIGMGDRHELKELSDWLAPFDDAMAAIYAEKSGKPMSEVAAWLDAETWMNGLQAIERGLADGVLNETLTEDTDATAQARDLNAVRATEIGLCRSMSRTDARALINKIKGTPGAAPDTPTPGAGDTSWLGAVAQLTQTLRS